MVVGIVIPVRYISTPPLNSQKEKEGKTTEYTRIGNPSPFHLEVKEENEPIHINRCACVLKNTPIKEVIIKIIPKTIKNKLTKINIKCCLAKLAIIDCVGTISIAGILENALSSLEQITILISFPTQSSGT